MDESDTVTTKKRKLAEIILESNDAVDSEKSKDSSCNNYETNNGIVPSTNIEVSKSGFSAYAKINPFTLGIQKLDDSSNISKKSWFETKGLAPITLPSPKSPKQNPFSSPSPVHNPFVSIVEAKDELWKAMAQNKQNEDDSEQDDSPSDSEESNNLIQPVDDTPTPSEIKQVFQSDAQILNGEEEEECLIKSRAKLYKLKVDRSDNAKALDNAEWSEVGIGPVKILRKKVGETYSDRLVVRREDRRGGIGIQVLLNIRLDKFFSVARQSETMLRIVGPNYIDRSSGAVDTFLLRFKTSQDSDDLFRLIHNPSAN